MRHRVAHRKLGRVTEHRIAMLRNQAMVLIANERIETTVARGKELRPFVERLITVAKRSLKAGAEPSSAAGVNARRMVAKDLVDRDVVKKLFDTIAPRFADRAGGYTRLLRMGRRRGDDAEVAQIEFIGSEFDPNAAVAKTEGEGDSGPKKRTIGERMRALGGANRAARVEKSKAPKASKGAARKVTTPRKAGGGGA
jgi:large subunit ribosomal protein L17